MTEPRSTAHPAAAKILALETSTRACSVALHTKGEVHELQAPEPLAHARYALQLCDRLLQEAGCRTADLDLVCFGRGPGSFIGLRVAAGLAQGLAYAAGIPLAPISSLAALAQAATGTRILCATDARMGEIYWAAYQRNEDGLVQLQGEEILINPETAPLPPGEDWQGAGDAWQDRKLQARMGVKKVTTDPPRAAALLPLAMESLRRGNLLPPHQGLPSYLREQVARRPRQA